MNIFYLDHNQAKCAKYHCDRHVVKMILETGQLLTTAVRYLFGVYSTEGAVPFWSKLPLATHTNHPCAVWVRQNRAHYDWLYNLFVELLREFEFRYGHSHSWSSLIGLLNPENFAEKLMYTGPFMPPPLCMPDTCKLVVDWSESRIPTQQMLIDYTVESYRWYYEKEKLRFCTYKRREWPVWLPRQLKLEEAQK